MDISRRNFIQVTGAGSAALGASLLLGKSAQAAPLELKSIAPHANPRENPKPGEKIHEFDIDLTITVHEILPGVKTHAFTYNGKYPGPEIRVPEGDWVKVNFTNKSPEFHTIHWHGIMLANEMDGVPNGTQWGVAQNEKFTYLFRAQPAGTHYYHCHNMTNLHVQAGMFGALIIEPKVDPIQLNYPYTREYTLALSEIDTIMVEQQLEEMIKMMGVMEKMNESAKLMKEMNGKMMGWFINKEEFVKAVENGYIPPYVAAKAGQNKAPNFNYFMINGKSYPMTESIMIKSGETIRVRLIGAGAMPHFMHLHGHDFLHVAQDGAPLTAPVRLNTIPIFPGTTSDIIIQGTNPGHWHFHDHSDLATTNNGQFPGGMMTMLMYEDADQHGVKTPEIIQVSS